MRCATPPGSLMQRRTSRSDPTKPFIVNRSRFKLAEFLDALHRFSLDHLGDGNPLPGVSGDIVYPDAIDLIEALSSDAGEEFAAIPDDSLGRIEMALAVFGMFASSNGFDGFDCVDGHRVEVPCLDDEDDEPVLPRRRRTAVENTVATECVCFGFVISLSSGTVEIEARGMSDVSGDCELEPLAEPNLLSDGMRRWVRSFLIPKRGGKA